LGPPTKIQTKAIPCVLSQQDVVAQAPSIQERIQSYIVPALQIIYAASNTGFADGIPPPQRGIQVLIITATVDQSAQAQRLSIGLGGSLGIRTSLCVGQGDLQQELATLIKSPPHVLVGTPQRLLELFSMRTLSTADVRLLIIDECDQLIARNLADYVLSLVRMLPPSTTSSINPGGSPIVSRSSGGGSPLPGAFEFAGGLGATSRQTAIYSCTVPQDVLNFASSLQLREPVRVLVRREGADGASASLRGLKQYFVYIAMGANSGQGAGGSTRRDAASSAREWKLEALADVGFFISFVLLHRD
jgi:translation initiation factor 4A